MQRLPLETQTLYAELLDRLSFFEAHRSAGWAPGSFVLKTVKGRDYYYYQDAGPTGIKRQTYLGLRSSTFDVLVESYREGRRSAEQELESIARLCAALTATGSLTTDHPSARVIRALADAGLFRLGGVLVGTHAFNALGNVLGVRWQGASLRTLDVDVAATRVLGVAVSETPEPLPSALDRLAMGFLPVPPLDSRNPSTSFKVRGQGLRVDLLTPAGRTGGRPVRITRFGAAAQPLRFLDYLIETTTRAAVIDAGGTLVNVPDPARFALHKLLVLNERPVTEHAKRNKDLMQAAQVLQVLESQRPSDLDAAFSALVERGPGWVKRVRAGLAALGQEHAEVAVSVASTIGTD